MSGMNNVYKLYEENPTDYEFKVERASIPTNTRCSVCNKHLHDLSVRMEWYAHDCIYVVDKSGFMYCQKCARKLMYRSI